METTPKAHAGSVPIPDPTALTTEQLHGAISNLEAKLGARLNAMDKAVELLHDETKRVPTRIDREIIHLTELIRTSIEVLRSVTEERFTGIKVQFEERDKRTEQLSLASATAIAAALQAQKEAAGAQNESNAASVTKSEASFTKQIDNLGTLFQSMSGGLDGKIKDLTSRIDKGEGTSSENNRAQNRSSTNIGLAISAAVGITFILTTLFGGVAFVMSHH